jgi:hypothetical protein
MSDEILTGSAAPTVPVAMKNINAAAALSLNELLMKPPIMISTKFCPFLKSPGLGRGFLISIQK